MDKKTAVALICVDSRFYNIEGVLDHIISQIKNLYGVDEVFPLTKPGPEGRVIRNDHHLTAIVDDINDLAKLKGVNRVIVIGHDGCAGHLVDLERRQQDIRRACDLLETKISIKPEDGLMIMSGTGPHWGVKKLTV